MKEKIGISGGTFDPIHYGHLIISEFVRDVFKLDRILFIPSGKPPHKKGSNVTEAIHRYEMTCRAIQSNKGFEVSKIEINRQGSTYTIDTLNQLKLIYGEEADLFFIIGADTLFELTSWKEFYKVSEICEFIVAGRPGYGEAGYYETIEALKQDYNARIHTIKTPLIDISSSGIRELIKNQRSIKYLVPESVEEYIHLNGLYSVDS